MKTKKELNILIKNYRILFLSLIFILSSSCSGPEPQSTYDSGPDSPDSDITDTDFEPGDGDISDSDETTGNMVEEPESVLSGGFISDLAFDASGNLFVGTEGMGIYRFDRESEQWSEFNNGFEFNQDFPFIRIFDLQNGPSSRVYPIWQNWESLSTVSLRISTPREASWEFDAQGQYVQIAVDPSIEGVILFHDGLEIYRRPDSDSLAVPMGIASFTDGFAGEIAEFGVDHLDSDHIVVAMARLESPHVALLETRDGGENWSPVDLGIAQTYWNVHLNGDLLYLHRHRGEIVRIDLSSSEDAAIAREVHSVAWWQGSPVGWTTDSGVYLYDGTTSQRAGDLPVHRGETVFFASLAVDPTDSDHIVGAGSRGQGLFESFDGGQSFQPVDLVLNFVYKLEIAEHRLIALVGQFNGLYLLDEPFQVFTRSRADHNSNFLPTTIENTHDIYIDGDLWWRCGQFIETIYFSDDQGETWNAQSTGLVQSGPEDELGFCAFYPLPSTPGYFVLTFRYNGDKDDGMVRKRGDTFEPIFVTNDSKGDRAQIPRSFAIDVQGRYYLWWGEQLLLSEDEGENWTEISVPDPLVRLLMDGQNAYLGTTNGLYRLDGDSQPLQMGPESLTVRALVRTEDEILIASVWGGGLYVRDGAEWIRQIGWPRYINELILDQNILYGASYGNGVLWGTIVVE